MGCGLWVKKLSSFDSILVRLKVAVKNAYLSNHLESFDSILVRLKAFYHLSTVSTTTTFRFHTGAIKSLYYPNIELIVSTFRFHTGSIKSGLRKTDQQRGLQRFDSILVRLKEEFEQAVITAITSFDSILVRLKVTLRRSSRIW